MRRDQLEHLLRAASTIVDDHDVVVFGSQAILATYTEDELPPETTFSIEADVTFFNDFDEDKSDRVDGAIGELSQFHETFGIYAQGVSITTAVVPASWRDRVVVLQNSGTNPAVVCVLNRTTSSFRNWLQTVTRTTSSPLRC